MDTPVKSIAPKRSIDSAEVPAAKRVVAQSSQSPCGEVGDEAVETFVKFLAKHDVSLEKYGIRLGESKLGGLGVFHAGDRKKADGEVIIAVPQSMLIEWCKGRQTDFGKMLEAALDKIYACVDDGCADVTKNKSTENSLPEFTVVHKLWLWLIHGRYTPSSFVHSYTGILPRTFSDTLHWSDVQLTSLLAGSNLFFESQERLQTLREIYDKIITKLIEIDPTTFPKEWFTFENFLWARSAYTSRSFGEDLSEANRAEKAKGNDVTATMLPLVDSFNHNPKEFAKVEYIDRPEAQEACLPTNGVVMRYRGGPSSVGPGEELWYNYGSEKGNEELLLAYGFTLADNSADKVAVKFKSMAQDDNSLQEKKTLLVELGVGFEIKDEQSRTFSAGPFYVASDGQIPLKLLRAAAIILGAGRDAFEILKEENGVVRKLEDHDAEHIDLMGESYSVLNQLFATKLETLINASRDQLENANGCDQHLAKLAENYKVGQVEIMQKTLRGIDARLDELENALGVGDEEEEEDSGSEGEDSEFESSCNLDKYC